jgi:hypothetical protein
MPVEENGDPPEPLVQNKPLNGKRLEPATAAKASWPLYRIPETAPERTAATRRLLERLGLDHGGVSAAPLWRARALLKLWWDSGASPAGLLWAIDHHPDRPDHHRGDAHRGTRDPLRVIGYRLSPWHGRLNELPATLVGIRGDYSSVRAPRAAAEPAAGGTAAARAAARAALDEHLRLLRAARRPPV